MARTDVQQPPAWLDGVRVRLRLVEAIDVPVLLGILAEPQVARWWRRAEWERVDERDAVTFVIELDEAASRSAMRECDTDATAPGSGEGVSGRRVAGCIQYTEETDPDYFSAAVDIFVATADQGRGIGPDAMRTLITWLIEVRGHHRVTVDPARENARAIRVYEKLGFRRVGVLRRYERVADGRWRDALLMELQGEELERA